MKGKHAAMAARRDRERAMSAVEQLDELVVEWKARAKAAEAAARRVPFLEREASDLRVQLNRATLPAVEAEEIAHEREVADLMNVIEQQRQAIEDMVSMNNTLPEVRIPAIVLERRAEWGLILECQKIGRRERRAQLFNRTRRDRSADTEQDNGRSYEENLGRRLL